MNRSVTDTTILGQSWFGRNSNEWILYIPQSSMTETSPSDNFVSNPEHPLEESYPSTEMQSLHSTAPLGSNIC